MKISGTSFRGHYLALPPREQTWPAASLQIVTNAISAAHLGSSLLVPTLPSGLMALIAWTP